jgi:hypothetical protein
MRVLADFKVNVTVTRVREAFVNEPLREPDDLVDVVGGLGEMVDRIDAQRRQVPLVVGRHLLGKSRHCHPTRVRFVDQLVVDVGDVHDPRYVVARIDEVPLDRVEDHRPDHVANVARLIDRRPAEVHADLAGPDRLKSFFRASERAVNAERICGGH